MSKPFAHELRVRYGECDPQGIVFNANYVAWFDVGLTELFRAAVGPWTVLVERGIDAVVAHLEVDFRAPARFDDVVRLEAGVEVLGTTSWTTGIDVVRDGELLVAGRLRPAYEAAGLSLDDVRRTYFEVNSLVAGDLTGTPQAA